MTTTTTMFPKIRREIARHYNAKRKEYAFFVRKGYFPHWAEEHRTNPDQGLRQYLTPTKLAAYQSGQLPRSKAVELATKRAMREVDGYEAAELRKLAAAEQAPDLEWADISVTWVRSRTWGHNPHVEARSSNGITEGKASGCGYDKESAAVASALNANPSVLRALYRVKEKHVRTRNADLFGYGSGYGLLPYLEGGVGVGCYPKIFEACGYQFKTISSGRSYDIYQITRR